MCESLLKFPIRIIVDSLWSFAIVKLGSVCGNKKNCNSVISAGFFGRGGRANVWGQFFGGRVRILLLSETLKFGVIFQKFALKLFKTFQKNAIFLFLFLAVRKIKIIIQYRPQNFLRGTRSTSGGLSGSSFGVQEPPGAYRSRPEAREVFKNFHR